MVAARGWARLILDRRRGLINDRPNCATAAEAPLDEAQERCYFDNPTAQTFTQAAHINTAKQHSALVLPCTFCVLLSTAPWGLMKNIYWQSGDQQSGMGAFLSLSLCWCLC